MTFATVTTLCRKVASADFTPTAIEFQHEAPADTAEHQRLFRCPIKFGAQSNRLYFESSCLSIPIEKADASLCALLDRHAAELLAKFPPRDSLLDQVRGIIASEFDANLRCDTCVNVRWPSAKLLTCSASPNRALSIAPSNVGPD